MKQFEDMIKMALKEDLKGLSILKKPGCPTASELADYLGGSRRAKDRPRIESHLAGCPACMEDLILAQKASSMDTKTGNGGKGPFFRGFKKSIWIILALVCFAGSFLYSKYFLQFLAATLILAAKWIFETVNARILIMIYDAWKKGGEKEVGKVLDRHNNRIRIDR